jgi:hypothetical protein
LTAENSHAWKQAKVNPARISKRDLRTLQRVCHPDTWAGVSLSDDQRKLVNSAAQILNRLVAEDTFEKNLTP